MKNMSPRASLAQLVALFSRFQKDDTNPIVYRLLTGRLKGQAFITLSGRHTSHHRMKESKMDRFICPQRGNLLFCFFPYNFRKRNRFCTCVTISLDLLSDRHRDCTSSVGHGEWVQVAGQASSHRVCPREETRKDRGQLFRNSQHNYSARGCEELLVVVK